MTRVCVMCCVFWATVLLFILEEIEMNEFIWNLKVVKWIPGCKLHFAINLWRDTFTSRKVDNGRMPSFYFLARGPQDERLGINLLFIIFFFFYNFFTTSVAWGFLVKWATDYAARQDSGARQVLAEWAHLISNCPLRSGDGQVHS